MNEGRESPPVGVTPRRAKAAAPEGRGPGDSKMTATYVRVMIVEAALIIALLIFGRLFS